MCEPFLHNIQTNPETLDMNQMEEEYSYTFLITIHNELMHAHLFDFVVAFVPVVVGL